MNIKKGATQLWPEDDSPSAIPLGAGLASLATTEAEQASLTRQEEDGICTRLEESFSRHGIGGFPRHAMQPVGIEFDSKGRVIRNDSRKRTVAARRARDRSR